MLIYILAVLSIIATVLPLIRHEDWWIRVFDFPRIQILVMAIVSLFGIIILVVFSEASFTSTPISFIILLCLVIIFQVIRIFPYTPFYKKQVKNFTNQDSKNHLSVLVTNVLMTNRNSGACISMIQKADPDIVLAVETDKWWEKELEVLKSSYPYHSFAPLANTYGLLFFSRFKVSSCEIKYLIEHQVPSIHCTLQLPSGVEVKFYGVHPKPPAPGESSSSINRDAELVVVGKEASKCRKPVIVAGDLNDVAWSHTTHLFQKISGLLDPRVGRGLFATFNAKHWLLRWPLDHIFHSHQFKIVEVKRLEYTGSDHFPMYLKLSYEPDHEAKEEVPEADDDDREEAEEKVRDADKT